MLKKPYIFTLDERKSYQTGATFEKDYYFFDQKNSRLLPWLVISKDGLITVNSGYSWDGCTPKIMIFGKVLGVPDGPISEKTGYPATYRASLFHDALCQFQSHKKMPLSREEIDDIFHEIMIEDGFEYADLYVRTVRVLGGIYSKIITRFIK